MRETRSLLSSAFTQETCHDLLRDHLSIRQLTWHVTMSASDRGTMSVYLRAKFENELGPQVGFELATHWLTAERAPERISRQNGGLTPVKPRCFAVRLRAAWLPSLVVLACKLFRDLEFGSPDHYTKGTGAHSKETAIRKLDHRECGLT